MWRSKKATRWAVYTVYGIDGILFALMFLFAPTMMLLENNLLLIHIRFLGAVSAILAITTLLKHMLNYCAARAYWKGLVELVYWYCDPVRARRFWEESTGWGATQDDWNEDKTILEGYEDLPSNIQNFLYLTYLMEGKTELLQKSLQEAEAAGNAFLQMYFQCQYDRVQAHVQEFVKEYEHLRDLYHQLSEEEKREWRSDMIAEKRHYILLTGRETPEAWVEKAFQPNITATQAVVRLQSLALCLQQGSEEGQWAARQIWRRIVAHGGGLCVVQTAENFLQTSAAPPEDGHGAYLLQRLDALLTPVWKRQESFWKRPGPEEKFAFSE